MHPVSARSRWLLFFDFVVKLRPIQRNVAAAASERDVEALLVGNKATMVTVWYEPPPGGPRSNLNRGGYYAENSKTPEFMKKLIRMRPAAVIIPAVSFFAFISYLPLSKYLEHPAFSISPHQRTILTVAFCRSCLFSEPEELAAYHERRARRCPESLHALPQHEPYLWSLQ